MLNKKLAILHLHVKQSYDLTGNNIGLLNTDTQTQMFYEGIIITCKCGTDKYSDNP